MRIIAKFAAAFFAVSLLGLTVYAYVSAQRATREIERNIGADLNALGDGLRDGILSAYRARGEAGALELVTALRTRREDIEIRWVEGTPAADGQLSLEEVEGGVRIVRAIVPVSAPTWVGGSLELRRPAPDDRAMLVNQLRIELMAAAGIAVLGAAVAVTLGTALIGAPLERAVAQARRIGAGDFSQRLREDRRDEIGVLKRELNAMCDRLVSARRGLEEESTARVEVLEQLRHLDRLRTVGTLASSLAHELGTPLNILLIRGQSLRDEKLDSGEVSEAGATVVSQVEKMRRIVQQLLDFARRRPPIRSEVRLSEVASRAKHLLSAMARKHGVEIELDVKTDASTLGDPTQLEQAVTNLMLNGIQAMTEGGVLRLEVRSEDSALAPNSSRPIRVGVLDTQDQGPGIGADELARIFEPFYTTKPEGSGTGLGLGVASGIAAEHGGWIKAASERGKGSSFALYLPRIT